MLDQAPVLVPGLQVSEPVGLGVLFLFCYISGAVSDGAIIGIGIGILIHHPFFYSYNYLT